MQFPVIMIILIIVGLFGSVVDTGYNTSDIDESDIIISTPSGGVIRSNADRSQRADESPGTTPTAPAGPSISEPAPEPEPPQPRKIPPIITTWAAQNIETDRALLRGQLEFPEAEFSGRLFFIYDTNERDVRAASPSTKQVQVSSRVRGSGQYTARLRYLNDDTTYFYRLCFEDAVIQCGNTVSFRTVEDANRYSSYRAPSVSSDRAVDIGAFEATVSASYRLYDADIATAFLVYGDSESAVRGLESRYDEYDEVREQGDALQKIRLTRNLASTGEFEEVLDDLERDTEYYYTFCIAYDDDDARGLSCSNTRSFQTREREMDDPSINFVEVNVAGTLVQMSATVSMGDYIDGYVFAVYGTDIDRVRAVENADRFTQVWQSGDAIQKISIDTDFDGRDRVFASARDLAPGVQYYRFCVEYERENDYGRVGYTLTCSDLRSFTAQ